MKSKVLNHIRDTSLSSMVRINQMKTGKKGKSLERKQTNMGYNVVLNLLSKNA
jgi:hypothetical protein